MSLNKIIIQLRKKKKTKRRPQKVKVRSRGPDQKVETMVKRRTGRENKMKNPLKSTNARRSDNE